MARTARRLIVHVVIFVLDQAVVSICEIGQGLVHLLTVVQILRLAANFLVQLASQA